MISSDSRSSPGLARWAESYEAKCERRQETRENRRRRRNETTCRQPGKVLRTQHKEQLQRARQLQFLKRRNLEEEKKGQASEKGPSIKTDGGTGQVSILKESLPGANKTSFLGQQETGLSSEVFPALHHPSSGIQRDRDDHHASHGRAFPPQESDMNKPHRHHRGTQTKAEETWSTIKNDASQQTNCGVAVLDKDIIQLSEYLKEALQRELILKQKMVILQDLLPALIRASDSSWKGQLNEDKLKGKLRSLENQLYTCLQKHSPWGMKKVLLEMEDQRSSYEQKAKASLQKVLEEKMHAEQQLQRVQLSLALAEQKCQEWKSQYEALEEDWRTLGDQHRELESQLHVLQSKLQSADSRDSQMSQALRLLENEHQELQTKLESLQGDREQQSSETQDLQDQLKKSEEEKQALVSRVLQLQSLLQNQSVQLQEQEKLLKKDQGLPVWNPKLPLDEVKPEGTRKEKDKELKDQRQKETSQLQAKEKECRELHSELDSLHEKYLSCLRTLHDCQEALSHSQEPAPRPCDQWLPVLTVVIVAALAVFLASSGNLVI
ncbi:TRAF3-interacting JNK-activating modulator isoform X3 [Apodemus sylvaticus]|uniref:TRAF3-interacting JNK-activating modulator isoform X3 n=1 Tax=Apodemus sylvaticus TaxID=10129 RepID=UPI0022421F19|nr:TRAF3-interacting JNK-activating modulator isoform X3 [Apodemus sylvaticus]